MNDAEPIRASIIAGFAPVGSPLGTRRGRPDAPPRWVAVDLGQGARLPPRKTADRARVAEYLWRESGKWAQKQPPEDFGSLRFYGRWGNKQGFRPVVTEEKLSEGAAYEIRRVLLRLQDQKRREDAQRGGYRLRPALGGTRGRDGLTVFNVNGIGLAPRLIPWAEELVLLKASQAEGAEPVWDWRKRVTLRAFSELEYASSDDDPEAEYEAWLEEQADREAALEAAIERHLAERDGWSEHGG